MVLQRYRAKQELGKGSFGTVYLTEGRRDKKPYVVKVVDNLRENNLKVQEIRVMMHLKHRNIVDMVDFYTSNNQLCIVMDYADGGDLRMEIIKARNTKTSIPEELIAIWLIQVCEALDYAHEEQIIHRDIKPSNIFLMADGRTVKVGDFGISKVLDASSGRDQMAAAETDGRVGTKRYMAPEVLNRQDYSNKADVWSLGCVLFELLTLNHPTYEQDRKIWFEWIPQGYTQSMKECCKACLAEKATGRPSPKELLVKLAQPFIGSPALQHEFSTNMQWYDVQLTQRRAEYESRAGLIRQFLPNPNLRMLKPQPLVPQAEPSPSQRQNGTEAVKTSASQPQAPQPAMVHNTSIGSESEVEHFNIPEYTDDEPLEEAPSQAKPIPKLQASSTDQLSNALSSASQPLAAPSAPSAPSALPASSASSAPQPSNSSATKPSGPYTPQGLSTSISPTPTPGPSAPQSSAASAASTTSNMQEGAATPQPQQPSTPQQPTPGSYNLPAPQPPARKSQSPATTSQEAYGVNGRDPYTGQELPTPKPAALDSARRESGANGALTPKPDVYSDYVQLNKPSPSPSATQPPSPSKPLSSTGPQSLSSTGSQPFNTSAPLSARSAGPQALSSTAPQSLNSTSAQPRGSSAQPLSSSGAHSLSSSGPQAFTSSTHQSLSSSFSGSSDYYATRTGSGSRFAGGDAAAQRSNLASAAYQPLGTSLDARSQLQSYMQYGTNDLRSSAGSNPPPTYESRTSLSGSFDAYSNRQQQTPIQALRSSYGSDAYSSQRQPVYDQSFQSLPYQSTVSSYGRPSSNSSAPQYPDPAMRSSGDGRALSQIATNNGYSLGGSLDAANLRAQETSLNSRMPEAPPRAPRQPDGDTSKVLEELERVRNGIRATLAAAAATAGRPLDGVSAPQSLGHGLAPKVGVAPSVPVNRVNSDGRFDDGQSKYSFAEL